MHIRNMLSIFGLVLAISILLPGLRADEANQATKVTFSQPVQIPGKTLPAGSYWIQLARIGDPGTVQIFSEKHDLIATLFTISRDRREPTDQVGFVLANQGEGKAEAIVGWFYSNSTQGHEFLYSKAERQEHAIDRKENVVAGN
jgi:hypothetical protein